MGFRRDWHNLANLTGWKATAQLFGQLGVNGHCRNQIGHGLEQGLKFTDFNGGVCRKTVFREKLPEPSFNEFSDSPIDAGRRLDRLQAERFV